MKPSVLCYLQPIVLTILAAASFTSYGKTTVLVTNKAPYSFTPTFEQTGPATLADKNWYKNSAPIGIYKVKHTLTDYRRDIGVSDHHLWEYLSTPDLSDKIGFGQHIWKKLARFGMEFTIQAPGTKEKWTSDEFYFWDNYLSVTMKDKSGAEIPLEIRCRSIPQFPKGNFKDVEYVVSRPLNKYIEYPKLPPTGPDTIAVFEYNTYLMTEASMKLFKMITWFVPSLKDLEKPGVSIRSKLIPEAIGPDFDVLALSEVWDNDARFNLLTGLKKQGYKYSTCILGSGFMSTWHTSGTPVKEARDMIKNRTGVVLEQPWIIDFNDPRFGVDKNYTIGGEGTFSTAVALSLATSDGFIGNGGVVVVSKWPIKETREWIFKETSDTDKYVKKGAVYAKIDKMGKIYNIIVSHTAGDMNIPSIAKFTDELKIPANEPVIIAGDLNANLFENKEAMTAIKSTMPEWTGSKITAACETNALRLWDADDFTVDFILYSNEHLKARNATVTVRKITSKTPWSDDKYPFAKEKPIRKVYDLSDHYALVGLLTFY